MTDQTDDKGEPIDQVPDEPTPTGDDAAETGGGESESGAEAGADHAESSEASETGSAGDSAVTDGEAGAPEAAAPEGDVAPAEETEVSAAPEGDAAPAEETKASTTGDGEAADDENPEAAWADALAETEGADTQAGIAEAAMTQVESAMPAPAAHPADFPEFGLGHQGTTPGNMDLLMDVKLPVSIELGRTTLEINDILKWGPGSIVELDKLAGEPVSLLVNNKLVAKGEVVVVDENFGLRITSLVTEKEHEKAR